ncbi:MAG: ribonuclease R [Acidiphilium sp.]|nr:ribonuclease R [Acidiphilium sp.]MDD4936063.1 ribonuclease R [Acidiphilium sp.]
MTRKSKKPASGMPAPGMPSEAALRAFIDAAGTRLGKGDIARAFAITPEQKPALRALLRDLERSGALVRAGGKHVRDATILPERCVVEITGTDRDGDPLARPVGWDQPGRPPIIFMQPEQRGQPALAPGARVLARLRRIEGDRYEGRTLKRLDDEPASIIGVFRAATSGETAGGWIEPVDRKSRSEWQVPAGETNGAATGDVVRATPLPAFGHGAKPARIVEHLGQMGDASSISLIAIATLGIPVDFSQAALDEAEAAKATRLGKRTDLRHLPLITIDGADARDFDDAVFAEPLGSGFRIVVAIADVAHYVRPGTALDREAAHRGNSVYFPDRVVPMLPEALSNGWCSLRPDEDRGCLFVEMTIDSEGRKQSHRFGRGLMRSFARMTYEAVQAAHDAGATADLPPSTLDNLYAAYRALIAARQARGTLDLDLPERQITLTDQGKVASITPRARLDSHRLIEEFMILANVAAAEELERLRQACMYRIHAPPSPEKLDALRSLLATFDIALKQSDQLVPRDLDHILKLVAGTDAAPLINETVLRSQSQAEYAPENIGHFGLALKSYAHFTSPIRRYADLLVHRALITGLKLGPDGLGAEARTDFPAIAQAITITERRATDAERQSTDRYLAAYLSDRIGEDFAARIAGVTRFGLFVTLTETGASGFIPMALLPDDFWHHDEATSTLSGTRSRVVFHLADPVTVRLREAKPVTGGLLFALLDGGKTRSERTETHAPRPKGGKQPGGTKSGKRKHR